MIENESKYVMAYKEALHTITMLYEEYMLDYIDFLNMKINNQEKIDNPVFEELFGQTSDLLKEGEN